MVSCFRCGNRLLIWSLAFAFFIAASSVFLQSGVDAAEPAGITNRPVTINTLSVFDNSIGVANQVTVWFDRTDNRRTSIAFIEDEIDGYGEMWRGAAWQAMLVAADVCGHDLAGTRIFLERSGRVDGPSAGGITTIGVLAALRGDTVKSDVAMTGTINPDGTIGPVSGIPHKIDGAAAAGMTTVLIPRGMRTDYDSELKRPVDLIERGKKNGLRVIPVGDIYTAYEIATDSKLPRPAPASAVRLSDAMNERLLQKIDAWRVRYREQLTNYQKVPYDYQSDYTDLLIEEAADWMADVDQLIAANNAASAYSYLVDATINAAMASEISRTTWVDATRGRKDASEYAEKIAQLPSKILAATKTLQDYQPTSIGQIGTLIYSYAALTEAISYQQIGQAMLRKEVSIPFYADIEDPEERELEQLLQAAEFLQVAAYSCLLVQDNVDIAGELRGRPIPEDMPLGVTAEFVRRTAQATLNQFEKSIVNARAEANGVSFAKQQLVTFADETDYLIAWWGLNRASQSLSANFEGEELLYAKLGLAIDTYALASNLMANNYSLIAEYDEDFNLTGVKRDGALEFQLDFSEDQLRRNIQMLRKSGVDTSDLVFVSMAAEQLRQGEIAERLFGLSSLWEANVVARTVAYLGGFADRFDAGPASP